VSEQLTVTLGARNAFDEYPDENNTDAGGITYAQIAGSQYPTTSPIGINGGFYYLRGVYSF
jgi:iron complex outermembrane receptor protein